KPPAPPMTPAKLPDALVRVSVLVPRATLPEPDKVLMNAPELVPEISKVPLSTTPLDEAMLPAPASASVPPEMVVAPVYVLTPDRVSVPAVSVTPPLPPIEPAKLPAALVSVSVLVPSATLPDPDSVLIEVPDAAMPAMSN